MKKVKIGVLGGYRGSSMINYCVAAGNAEVVAICDKWEPALKRHQEIHPDTDITYYLDFEEFIKHDMDAVVLANYATEHAPFAIRAMKEGKHVFSEVLPCQTMKEAVELVEAVEKSNLVYAYGENFCYMPAPYEMKRLYEEGKIGEIEYAECEYIHNAEPIWHSITYGEEDHWRNNVYSTFYCTHSLGPIVHITKQRPVRVFGMESHKTERKLRIGAKSGQFAIEMVELENGGIIKSVHGHLYKDSHYYQIYGSKGRMESARPDTKSGNIHMLYVNADEYSGEYGEEKIEAYKPTLSHAEISKIFGHGGGDFYSMYYFVEKILGDKNADTIDVYEALDMALPGMFAYRSILAGGMPMDIPDLRNKEEREKWRNDTACSDPKVAGDMLWPVFSGGNPQIPEEVYKRMMLKHIEEFEANTGYVNAAFTQSSEQGVEAREHSNDIMMRDE